MFEQTVHTLIAWIDVIGVAVFAISGALEASRRQMDIVGFILIATVTAIGGGTVRDLLLGITPVSWIASPHILILCICSAVFVFFTAHKVESRFRMLLWADAIGLAVFSIIGTQKAIDVGVSSSVAILMGTVTATFGGLVRDIICNEVPLILRREIYATAAAAGSASYVLMHSLALPEPLSVLCAFFCGFSIRALAIVKGLSLPSYRSRPGRKI